MTELLTVSEQDAIEFMYERGWTDGLPVVPPTPAKVEAMLAAVGRDGSEILGTIAERRKTITAELVAINAVMAGCLPDYFPIVLTAIEATLDPAFNLNTVATSTGGAAICVIVAGPIGAAIGMNSGLGALGSGNRANATIGRAVRLMIANGLGAKSGMLDATSVGHPGKYTFCFAARDAIAPWISLQETYGYRAEDTTVTVLAADGPRTVANMLNEEPEAVLRSFVAAMKMASSYIVGKGGQVAIVLGHEHELAVRQGGFSQRQAREFLAHESRVTVAELSAAGIMLEIGNQHDMTADADGTLPVVASADDIILVSAGGPGAGWSSLIPAWAPTKHSRFVTRRVREVGEALPDCGPEGCAIDADVGLLRSALPTTQITKETAA